MTDRLKIKPGRYSVVPWRAADDERLTRSDMRMLMHFGRRVNGAGFVVLSQIKLSGEWGVTRQAVSKIITKLIKLDYVRKHEPYPGAHGVWVYELISDAVFETLAGDECQPSEVDRDCGKLGDCQLPEVDTQSTGGVDTPDTESEDCQPPEVAGLSTIAVDHKSPLFPPIRTSESNRQGGEPKAVDNPPPDLGGFRLACRCPDFEQAALAFIASQGRDTWLSWFGSAGLTGADPPCLELPSQFAAAHVRTHFLEFFETRLGRKITIKVNRARRAQGTGRAAGPQRPAVRQSKGGRYAAR